MPVFATQSSEIPLVQIRMTTVADLPGDEQLVAMPIGFKVLTARARNDCDISIYFSADPQAQAVPEPFLVARTSDSVPENAAHLASFPAADGELRHLFRLVR